MDYIHLKKYGLTQRFEQEAAHYEGLYPARVTEQHRDKYIVVGENGEMQASVSGKFAYDTAGSEDFPAVGDWVMLDRPDGSAGDAVIHRVLPRQSAFLRKVAGSTRETQVVAANIDLIFICMSLNADFNLRRLERYLSIAWDSSATPVILLTKADLCPDVPTKLAEVSAVSVGAEVVLCSSLEEGGIGDVLTHIPREKTVAFVGSSGVGKSTLINRLLGRDILDTREIRKDDRGRHATTTRQLLLLPGGGIVIDTPGMRELQLESGNLARSFEDIAELSLQCRYKDCSHSTEPGCAVKSAIETGELSQARFDSYEKLRTELRYEGLNSRQLEHEKIRNMFGSLGEMKQAMRYAKNKHKRP